MKTTELNRFELTLTITRLVVGFSVLAHGVQKLFGWFGGYGFNGTMGFFTETIGLPYVIGLIIIIAESFGMVALIAGFLTRFLSVSVALIMLGAILTTHGQFGYFMNWSGTLKGEGFEYHILLIALAMVNAINGAGYYAIDNWLGRKLHSQKPVQAVG